MRITITQNTNSALRGAFFMGGSMFKRIYLALAILAGLLSPAHSAGTIPWSLSQQQDALGKPLAGCKLYIYAAGTTTPQSAYQDTALTNAWPNPLICDSAGRLPQFFLADGLVKIRITDKNGVTQAYAGQGQIDNILVIGPSSGGGGGGGSVDPTTIIATGDIKARYGVGVLTGFVRANGRTIGSATSGATERANADAQALFEYLWGTDANLAVSTGRGASANADWVANKTITLPDWRGRSLAAMPDMGNTQTVLTTTYCGADPTVFGAACGDQAQTLGTANLPPYTPSGSVSSSFSSPGASTAGQVGLTGGGAGAGTGNNLNNANLASPLTFAVTGTVSSSFSGNAQGGTSTPFSRVGPIRLATFYIKL